MKKQYIIIGLLHLIILSTSAFGNDQLKNYYLSPKSIYDDFLSKRTGVLSPDEAAAFMDTYSLIFRLNSYIYPRLQEIRNISKVEEKRSLFHIAHIIEECISQIDEDFSRLPEYLKPFYRSLQENHSPYNLLHLLKSIHDSCLQQLREETFSNAFKTDLDKYLNKINFLLGELLKIRIIKLQKGGDDKLSLDIENSQDTRPFSTDEITRFIFEANRLQDLIPFKWGNSINSSSLLNFVEESHPIIFEEGEPFHQIFFHLLCYSLNIYHPLALKSLGDLVALDINDDAKNAHARGFRITDPTGEKSLLMIEQVHNIKNEIQKDLPNNKKSKIILNAIDDIQKRLIFLLNVMEVDDLDKSKAIRKAA